jgi:uncharacterized membrane protein YtjA (UPF0391 family)
VLNGCRAPRRQAAGAAAMLYYAVVFFVIALIAGLFGFTGVAAGAATIAKFLFGLFIVLFLVTVVLALAGISIFT